MPLERTPKYDDKIEAVRKLPQETLEQKAEKKEASALLRMEALFDNAACAKFYVEHILANPDMTREDFLYDAEQIGGVVHPEATEAFIDKLIETRSKIIDIKNWSYEKISDEDFAFQKQQLEAYVQALHTQGHSQDYIEKRYAEKRQQIAAESEALIMGNFDTSHWLGQKLFTKYLSKTPEKPKGQIRLDLSHPLAVVMNFTDKEDYKKIDPQDNVGGFFRAEQKVETFSFPFVAINAEKDDYVQKHEIGHSENAAFKNTVVKKPGSEIRRVVWGHTTPLTKESIDFLNAPNIDNPKLTDNEKAELITKRENLKERLLSYALARAKDELLANYQNTPKDPFAYKSSLIDRKDLYDYFKKAGLSETSPSYSTLQALYEDALDDSCTEAQFPALMYARKGLMKRYEIYRWVLAQIPLEDWSKQLSALPFERELDLLTDLDSFEISENGQELSEQRRALIMKYHQFLRDNETGLLVPGLLEIEKEQKAIIAQEKEEEEKRRKEAAERERKRQDEALMKVWEQMEDYEKMLLDSVRQKATETIQRKPKGFYNRNISYLRQETIKELDEAKQAIINFFGRRCQEEGIMANQEFLASYLDDHHWNSNIAKIREDKLPGWQMYTSL